MQEEGGYEHSQVHSGMREASKMLLLRIMLSRCGAVKRCSCGALCAFSATKDATTVLSAPIQMGLDDSLEYLAADELIEVG